MPLLEQAFQKAEVSIKDIDQIAVTAGPGLLGPLLTGLTCGKALAWQLDRPLIPVNHIEAHLTAAFLSQERLPEYPFLGLIVSGGHSNLVIAKGPRDYETLGYTVDDAPGELFDKVARHLQLGYPGGPIIQKTGEGADQNKYPLPRPMANKGYLFSFSGLKTAVIRLVAAEKDNLDLPALCAALQFAVADVFSKKVAKALKETKAKRLVVAGGVAANKPLRETMSRVAGRFNAEFLVPNLHLCTDNAAMIAAHGYISAKSAPKNSLMVNATANWEMGAEYYF